MMGIIINNQIMSAEHKFNLIPYHMLLWKQFLFRAHLCLRKDILRTASGNILTPTYGQTVAPPASGSSKTLITVEIL